MREPRYWEDALYDVLEFLIDDQAWLAQDDVPADTPQERAETLCRNGVFDVVARWFRRRGQTESMESPDP